MRSKRMRPDARLKAQAEQQAKHRQLLEQVVGARTALSLDANRLQEVGDGRG